MHAIILFYVIPLRWLILTVRWFFLPFLLHVCNELNILKEFFMHKIKDPMISCNGRIYSLAGLKLLLTRVTKGVCSEKNNSEKRKKQNGEI